LDARPGFVSATIDPEGGSQLFRPVGVVWDSVLRGIACLTVDPAGGSPLKGLSTVTDRRGPGQLDSPAGLCLAVETRRESGSKLALFLEPRDGVPRDQEAG
jgi:hypothetical protein